MKQTESTNNSADGLQRQNDQQLAHETPPRNWIIRNWKTVASVGGLIAAAGGGVALLDWGSRAIDDVAAALNFFTQNTFSLLIFLAVIVQAVISNRQWRAMKDSVERTDTMIKNMEGQLTSMENQEKAMEGQLAAMERQTEYAHRAYVCIPAGSLKVVEEIGTKKRVEVFWFRIENTGNTPANAVSVRSFAGIAAEIPDPALLTAANAGHQHQVGVIAPHAHHFYFVRVPVPSSEQIQQWVDGKVEVYCSGFVSYRSFGQTRTTKFCFLRRPGASGDFEAYGKWSEAD